MSEPKPGARPSQVTMAGWVAIVGSALLVLTLFESMSQVRSIETRESIEEFLSGPLGSGLGVSVPTAVEILRGLMLVSGAAAAVAMVLGIYVLQRNRGARLGYTIAAAAIMLTAPVAGGFLPVLIAFAAVMLWSAPAREWFSGTGSDTGREGTLSQEQKDTFFAAQNPSQSPDSAGGSGDRVPDDRSDETRSSDPNTPGAHAAPAPTQGFGAPDPQQGSGPGSQPPSPYAQGQPPSPYAQGQPDRAWAPPAYGQQPQQYGRYPAYPQQDHEKRPTTVTIAAWLTWVFAGLTLVAFGLVVIVLLAAKDQFLEALRAEPQFQELDIAADDLVAALWVMSAIMVFWCLSAIVLAVFAFRRSNAARIALVVSAGMAALFSVGGFPFALLHTIAAGATVALLFVGGAHQWYSRKNTFSGYPPPGGESRQDEKDPPKNVW